MSLNDSTPTPHMLNQFARRAGITESYARKLYSSKPSKLPAPDGRDADGRPWWIATTIDAWCRTTDRAVAEDAAWLYRAPDAYAPADVLFHGLIDYVPRPGGRPFPMFAKCWGIEHGHLVYLREVDDVPGDRWLHYSQQALAAAEVVAPRFWPNTLVLVDGGLPYRPTALDDPPDVLVEMYRLVAQPADGDGEEGSDTRQQRPESVRERITRLLGRAPTIALAPEHPRPTAIRLPGSPEATDVARVIGAPMPAWIRGTCRPEAIDRARAYSTTFTVPDTASIWPATLDRLKAAHQTGLASSYPAAFALLAADATATLTEVRDAHTRTPQRGPGWCLVARPAAPALPLDLELELAGLPPLSDIPAEQITTELADLRRAEADLPADDGTGEGDVLEHAVTLLTIAAEPIDPRLAVDTVLVEAGRMHGEVADQWRSTLRPHPDRDSVWATRRGRRLLDRGRDNPSDVRELLSDQSGRLIALVPSTIGELDFVAEWPTGLPSGWNETTIIAGDYEEGLGYGPVLALTRTADGLRADLIPAPPGRTVFGGFTWGYGGSGPSDLYEALVRVACDKPLGLSDDFRAPDDSRLVEVITTTKEALRIRWTDLLTWARHDIPDNQEMR